MLRDRQGKPVPFDISYREFSRISKKGGKLQVREGVTYLPSANPEKEIVTTIHNVLDPVKASKDPNHFENKTRNLQLQDGRVRKLNIDYIISINNQTVIY